MRLREFRTVCEADAVSIRIDTANKAISVDAPPGRVFAATGLHFMTQFAAGPWRWGDIYADLADDISAGTELCEGECHICGR